jgi:ABC-type glutathione transport system ATPase component
VRTSGTLLSVDISADYPGRPGVLSDVSFTIASGDVFGLIGQSGSGKSTLALALLRLLELRGARVRGAIHFDGRDVMRLSGRELRRMRGREMALVLQSPMLALNPALRIETQLREVWRAHRAESWRQGLACVRELLARMRLPTDERFLRSYPGEISVGQAQRVVITMASMHRPKLLIADEPTSALDPRSGAEILNLFRDLNREFGTAILYVSHDLASVAALCRRVGVISQGRLVETGSVERVLAAWGAARPLSPGPPLDFRAAQDPVRELLGRGHG